MSVPEDDYQPIIDELARFQRQAAEQAERWRRGNFTPLEPLSQPKSGPQPEGPEGADGVSDFEIKKMSYAMPISDELAMDYGLIPDTRPAPHSHTWRERARTKVQQTVRDIRWRVAAKIGGARREDIEEASWLW